MAEFIANKRSNTYEMLQFEIANFILLGLLSKLSETLDSTNKVFDGRLPSG
jgi:hypothetical protein